MTSANHDRTGLQRGVFSAVMLMTVLFPLFVRAADMPPSLDSASAERFAALALKCLHQEYPNKISHTMTSDADARAPRELTPAFFGCYDWHSAVHGHWLLARLVRLSATPCGIRRVCAAVTSRSSRP